MARKKLETLTEQMYYVLLSLTEERRGYGIMQFAAELTDGRVNIRAGTLYALLSRFEAEGLIRRTKEDAGRKYYLLTGVGRQALEEEYDRLNRSRCAPLASWPSWASTCFCSWSCSGVPMSPMRGRPSC